MTIPNNGSAPANRVRIDISLSAPLATGVKLSILKNGSLLSDIATGGGGTIFSYIDQATFTQNSYTVKCVSAVGEVKTSPAYVVTLSAPPGSTSTPVLSPPSISGSHTSTSATLTWGAIAQAASYRIYQDGVMINERGSNLSTTFTATGLTSSSAYNFRVSTVNSEGVESGPSNTYVRNGVGPTTTLTNVILSYIVTNPGTNYNQFESIPVFADGEPAGFASGPNQAALSSVEILNPGAGLLDGTYPWNGTYPSPEGFVTVTGGTVVSYTITNPGAAFSGPIGPITVNVDTDPAFVGSVVYPILYAVQTGPAIGAAPIIGSTSKSYPVGYVPTITSQSISVSNGTGLILTPVMGNLEIPGAIIVPPAFTPVVAAAPASINIGGAITFSISAGKPNESYTYSGGVVGVTIGNMGNMPSGSGVLSATGTASFTIAPVQSSNFVGDGDDNRYYNYTFVFAGSASSVASQFMVTDPNWVAPPPPPTQVGDIDPIKGVVIGVNAFGLIFGPKGVSNLPAPHQRWNVTTGEVNQRPGATYPVGVSGNIYWSDPDMRFANDLYVRSQAEFDSYNAYANNVPALMATYRREYYEINGFIPVGGVIVSPNPESGNAEAYADDKIAPLLAANNWYPPVW